MSGLEGMAEGVTVWAKIVTFLSFGLAALLCHTITPVAIRIALSYNLVDRPDGRLKNQAAPVPYLGGMSIYLAFLLTLAVTYDFNREVLALLLAGTIVVLFGLVDDIGALSPKAKFLGQSLAILALMKAGILIEIVYLPWYVSYPLTYLWLLGMTNAFNIIDIMDGLSAGVGFIAAASLLTVAVMNGNAQIAVITATLAGSLLGFLRFNFDPARIYLGDTGSLFIGLNLGALAMIGRYTDNNPVAVIVPVVLLGVPIFDTLFVMYVRRLRGISMFLGSPDHFALRLRKWALSKRQTILASYGAALFLAVAGIAIMMSGSRTALAIVAALLVGFLLAVNFLRKIETGL